MKFKKGDKVRINGDMRINWNSNGEMDITIGEIGIVEYATSSGSCQVVFKEGLTRKEGWYYHKECLTLVPNVIVPEKLFIL